MLKYGGKSDMTRQLEQELEDRGKRERDAVVQAVYGGLVDAISSTGRELQGFSAKLSGGDCLITLRAIGDEGAVVGFVGSEDLAACLRKVVREAHRGELRWRDDAYAK
jgi:hypothetical protein